MIGFTGKFNYAILMTITKALKSQSTKTVIM